MAPDRNTTSTKKGVKDRQQVNNNPLGIVLTTMGTQKDSKEEDFLI
jgi:hypothetical protein